VDNHNQLGVSNDFSERVNPTFLFQGDCVMTPDIENRFKYSIGTILMWSGLLANIPMGWQLCDGTNGTPNLLAKFGRQVPTGATDPGDVPGSSDTHTLTTPELPTHNHGITDPGHIHPGGGGSPTPFPKAPAPNGPVHEAPAGLAFDPNSGADTVNNSPAGTSHDNRPAYYELAFIQKVT